MGLTIYGILAFAASHVAVSYLQRLSGTKRQSFYYEGMAVMLIVLYGFGFLSGVLGNE